MLRMGDALELDDGSLVDMVIEPEPLIEVRGNDLTHLARLAWHLGDRHVPVQMLTNRLRLRRDAALEAMLRGARRAADADRGAVRSRRRRLCDARARARSHGHHHDHDHCRPRP